MGGIGEREQDQIRGRETRHLKVLMWMASASEIPGGHVVQLHSTAQALRDLGLDVVESTEESPDLADVDIVHGFGLSPAQAARCRQERKPLVVSTIYWGFEHRLPPPRWGIDLGSLRSALGNGFRSGRAALIGHNALMRRSLELAGPYLKNTAVYAAADLLLPNAEGEGEAIRRELGVHTRQRVIPNAVSLDLFPEYAAGDVSRRGVLCVGRIEPHKNQLRLIHALEGTGILLTLAGPPHPHHPRYYEQCRRAGAGWVKFVDGLPQRELSALYRSAKVHVLPSWFETTGLVSLEAAMCGCTVVSTDRGYAHEYLGEDAWYCDPSDDRSIRKAVLAASGSDASAALRQRIKKRYTWRSTAEATVDAYAEVL